MPQKVWEILPYKRVTKWWGRQWPDSEPAILALAKLDFGIIHQSIVNLFIQNVN